MTEQENKPSNPNAFPFTTDRGEAFEGMTLRDYFANEADVSIIVSTLRSDVIKDIIGVELACNNLDDLRLYFELEAKLKYLKADAMLKQREL